MAVRLCLFVLSYFFVVALPGGVLLTVFCLERPSGAALWGVGIVLLCGGVSAVEYSYRFLAATGRDLGLTSDVVRVQQGIMLVYPPVVTFGLFSLVMEADQAHLRACCVAYLAYAVVVVLVAAGRWRSWSVGELLYMRLGWVPAVVLGLPWLIPTLKAAGLLRDFG